MKKILIIAFGFLSCQVEKEPQPINEWWLSSNKCVEQYTVTDNQTIYRFCWVVDLECKGVKTQVNKCFFTNCEILEFTKKEYPDCKIVGINKVK